MDPMTLDKVVIELPAVWVGKGSSKKTRAAARGGGVVKIAVMVGLVAGLVGKKKVELVDVGRWKGQVKKSVTQRRVARRWGIKVGDDCAGGLMGVGGCEVVTHDTVDAVGIGQWYLYKKPFQRLAVAGRKIKLKRTRTR